MTTVDVTPGTTFGTAGAALAQVTLDATSSYIVSASVTATAPQNDSVQCQLGRPGQATWDAMAENDLGARTTVDVEHAYAAYNTSLGGTFTVTLGCLSASANYAVDTAHIYVTQVGSINGGIVSHPMSTLAPSLRWSGIKPAARTR